MDLGLAGKRALVTGASKGIGRQIAGILAGEGCNVSICARHQPELDAAVAALQANGVTALGRTLDVADKAALEAWVEESAKALGGIDIVVANVSALSVDASEES